jgi:hypothetical protein
MRLLRNVFLAMGGAVLACLGSVNLGVAQDGEQLRAARPAIEQPVGVTKPAHQEFAGKGSEITQRVSGNGALTATYDEAEDRFTFRLTREDIPRDTACFLFYRWSQDRRGFLGGTMDTTTVTRTSGGQVVETYLAYVAQHGIRFQAPLALSGGSFYVDRVYVYFAEGTRPNPRSSKPDGQYFIRLYPSAANGSITNTTRPIFEQGFSVREFPLEWTPGEEILQQFPFFYPNPGQKPGNEHALSRRANAHYSLMIDVVSPEAEDSLNLTFLSNHCVPENHPEGLVYLRDPQTFALRGFSTFPFFFGGRRAFEQGTARRFPYAPFIAPILFFDTELVSRNDKFSLGKQGGLELLNAYPIPAVDYTNIRFRLDHNDDVTLRVMDNLGREVHRAQFRAQVGETSHQLDTREWPCGAYSFIVETTQGLLGSRFLIER